MAMYARCLECREPLEPGRYSRCVDCAKKRHDAKLAAGWHEERCVSCDRPLTVPEFVKAEAARCMTCFAKAEMEDARGAR